MNLYKLIISVAFICFSYIACNAQSDFSFNIHHIGGNGGPTATIYGVFQGNQNITPPFTINITSPDGSTSNITSPDGNFTIPNLIKPGDYCFTISSSNNCELTQCIRVYECFIGFKGFEICDDLTVLPDFPIPLPDFADFNLVPNDDKYEVCFIGHEDPNWTNGDTINPENLTFIREDVSFPHPNHSDLNNLSVGLAGTIFDYNPNDELVIGNTYSDEFKTFCSYAATYEINISTDGKVSYELSQLYVRSTSDEDLEIRLSNIEELTLSPNPANHSITAELKTVNEDLFITSVSVINLQGSSIYKEDLLNTKTKNINLMDLPDGIYICSIKLNNGKYINKRFVKTF